MRRTLILGGTAWLGHEIATQLVARGGDVTCLARGESGPVPDGATLIKVDRNDPAAYDGVKAQSWDDVIELSYDPVFVAGALAALAGHTAHWTLVSSVSVYATNSEPNADETAEVLDPADPADYGQAKVAVERASAAAIGDRLLIARPGLIVGPGDPSDRFGYWVARFALAQDEPVLAPISYGRYVQIIDARDLAAWIIGAGHAAATGTFNIVGNAHPLNDVLNRAAAVAGHGGARIEAADEWLVEHDVNYWAGPRSLPLWLPDADAGFCQRSNAAFRGTNPELRPLDGTLSNMLEDERRRGLGRERRSGLTRAEEVALIEHITH